MRDLANIASRVFNTPLLIHPGKAEVIAAVLLERMGDIKPAFDLKEAEFEALADRADRAQALGRFDFENRFVETRGPNGESRQKYRYGYKDGLALITIDGSLVNRGSWIGSSSGLVSYEGIAEQISTALVDPQVDQILLDIDSPGGEAAGAFELGKFIRSARARKPITALVDSLAASGGYAIASSASRIVTTPSGSVGSIGVVLLHLDHSRRLKKAGVAPTFIYAGAHKVDGNPYEPLPDSVRADLQAEIDALYSMFVQSVAAGRTNLSEDAVRATQARVYTGGDAIGAGLADDIGTLTELVEDLTSRGISRIMPKGPMMDRKEGAPAADAGITQAALDEAVATATLAGKAEGEKAGRAAATGEMLAAFETLFEKDPRAEAFADLVKDGLSPAAAAKHAAKVVQPGASLFKEMAETKQPNIGADAGDTKLSGAQKAAAESKALIELAGGLPSKT